MADKHVKKMVSILVFSVLLASVAPPALTFFLDAIPNATAQGTQQWTGEYEFTANEEISKIPGWKNEGRGTFSFMVLPDETIKGEGNEHISFGFGPDENGCFASVEADVDLAIEGEVMHGVETMSSSDIAKNAFSFRITETNLPAETPLTCPDGTVNLPAFVGTSGVHLILIEAVEGAQIKDDPGSGATEYTLTIHGSVPKLHFIIDGNVGVFSGTGKKPLPKSILVLGEYDEMPKEPGDFPLTKLSTGKPGFEQKVVVAKDGEYKFEEIEKTRDKNGYLPTMVVASLLWYDSDSNPFAVTSTDGPGGTRIPLYIAQCVGDEKDPKNRLNGCLTWEKSGTGNPETYKARLNFNYGGELPNKSFMKLEEWKEGSAGSVDQLMQDGGTVFYNSYNAFRFLEDSKASTGTPLKPVMIQIRDTGHAGCVRNPDGAFYDINENKAFGDLGKELEKVDATGHTIYICDLDSPHDYPDAPINREYHELSHYFHYQMYDFFKSSCNPSNPHEGYKNCNSNWSMIEGFASFNALLINEYITGRQSSLYPLGAGVMNVIEYKVWGVVSENLTSGSIVSVCEICAWPEEFAVAGTLWDFHDRSKEIDFTSSKVYRPATDDVSLSAVEILKLVQDKKPYTLVDLYNAFRTKGTTSTDMIFVNHGAFDDIVERNYVHDQQEKIGYTGSLSGPVRPVRESPRPLFNGSFIQTNGDASFEVKIVHDQPYGYYDFSYMLNMTENKPAYFEMPPAYYPSTAYFSQVAYLQDNTTKIVASNVTTVESTKYWDHIASDPESSLFETIPVQAVSAVPAASPATNPPPTGGNSQCLIATAAFGSELTPQVQFLRAFRDNHILSTASGSSFMNVFNAWYYSFSPAVADFERKQPWLQQVVKVSIYPLIGILQASEKAYFSLPGEFGALSAGLIASSMIGAVYFTPVAVSIKRLRTGKFRYRLAACVVAATFIAAVVSIMVGNTTLLMLSTSSLVIAVIGISAALVAKSIMLLATSIRGTRRE